MIPASDPKVRFTGATGTKMTEDAAVVVISEKTAQARLGMGKTSMKPGDSSSSSSSPSRDRDSGSDHNQDDSESCTSADDHFHDSAFPWSWEEMKETLGDGPMRFAPKLPQETISSKSDQDSITSVSSTSYYSACRSPPQREKRCCEHLKKQWEATNPHVPFSYEMYLRLQNEKQHHHHALATTTNRGFEEQQQQPEYVPFGLSIEELEPQLLTETLFPVPGLRSKEGLDIFYMRPSKYFPRQTPTEDIVDNLAYVMQSMSENDATSRKGIGFLAYMSDWKYEHFSVRYCSAFMAMLQQPTPAKVEIFLIVDPPGWFPAIWRIIKGMLSRSFRKKVFMIKEESLDDFMEEGFEAFLPDDMKRGKVNSSELVKDFIAYRKFVEDTIGIDL